MNLDDIRKKYGLGTGEDKTNNSTSQNQSSTSRTKSSLEELRKKHGVGNMTDEQLAEYEKKAKKGSEGWQKYLDDQKKSQEAAAQREKDKKWYVKLAEYLGEVQDTTLPMSTTTQVINDLSADTRYGKRPQDDWSEEQKKAFGEIYLENPGKAYDYAGQINAQNNKAKEEAKIKEIQDSATDNFGSGVGHTAAAIATAPLALADYLNYIALLSAGKDASISDGSISPFEYSQAVTEGISTHLNEKGGTINEDIPIIGGKGWGDVYGLGTSIVQSAVSGYTLGGVGTLISYFGQGAASGMKDALSRGATEEQAVLYGTALGAFEGIAESIGIDNLFKLSKSAFKKELLKNILKQAGAEGLEEGLTSFLGNIADNVIMQDQSNFNVMVAAYMSQGMTEEEAKKQAWMDSVEGIVYDALGGFVSGGVHGGTHTMATTAISNYDASKRYGNDSQKLIDDALSVENNSALHGLAEKYKGRVDGGKNLTGGQINRLIETYDKAKLKNAILQRLGELGEAGDVTPIANALVKKVIGEELTLKENQLLNDNKNAHIITAEMNPINIKSGGLGNKWAESIGTKQVNPQFYNKDEYLYSIAKQMAGVADEGTSVKKTLAESGGAKEAKIEVSDNGKTIYYDAKTDTSTDVEIKRIVSTEGGIKVELEDGNTVSAKDLRFGTREEGVVYEMIARMDVTPDTANEILNTFKPTNEKQAALYFDSVPLAYRMGLMGNKEGLRFIRLSDAQKQLVYNRGRMDAITNAENRDKARATGAKKVTAEGIIFENGYTYDESKASEMQRTSMEHIDLINKVSNLEVHVYESWMEDGKLVAKVNGKIVKAPNGYFTDGNKIYIDINAGNKGEGAMLYTMSHEITHYIRKWNPKGFKELADFLIAEYGKKGVDVTGLIQKQKEKIKNRYTEEKKALPSEPKLFDMAYEELVADAMSDMLTDPKAYEKLAKLKQQNYEVWQKLGEAIKSFLDKVKNALGIYKTKDAPVAREAFLARGFSKEVYEKLQDLYIKAFVEADANYSAAEETLSSNGIIVDSTTESATIMSVRDVLDDTQRQDVAKALATRFGVTKNEALQWLTAETSLASLILNPKYSQYLDYVADPNEVAIKTNSDYPQGTVDFSPICAKRREFTSVMNNILRLFPNHVFAATDLAKIRTIMQEEGMTIPCGICYVEDRRQLDTIVAQNFIDSLKLYREGSKKRPDGKPFNANQLKGLSLIDGDSYTPSIYELVSLEGLNVLKEKNPSMAEAWIKFNNARGMQSVRLLANEAEYKRQILKYTKATVKAKNDKGGLRVYSFSDAEMFHLIDIIQVITDSATVGLSLQGYTKVNEYARAVKDTGEKLNRSLIPKGELGYHIEDGKVILDYDTVEGIDINHPDFFDNKDNPNVGNITIGVNDTQIRAAMISDFVDQIIPFHTGQSEEVLGEKGIATWSNYKDFQTEKDIATGKVSEHQINIYTEVLQVLEKEGKPITKRTFVEKFLQVCKDNGLTPRFSQFLNTNENGEYVYTEGYHKMLVDFKTFAQTEVGEYLPQMPVKPIFDNEYITKILKDYVKSQKVKDAELAKSMPRVIERITNELVNPSETMYSERDYPIDAEVDKTVKDAFAKPKGTMLTLSDITSEQNKAINRLVNQTNDDSYRGKFTGGRHRFPDNAVRHIINEHGDFLREGLRAQLPMSLEDIARHFSAVKDNKKPTTTKPSRTKRGNPSILTSYEVNGYTLYAEEITKPLGKNLPSDLIGHTMYKAPTLATAAFYTTSVQTQPKRQSTVLCDYYSTKSKNLSRGNFVADANGSPALLSYTSLNGSAKQDASAGGLIALSSDKTNFTDKASNVEQGYVLCKKPFYITQDNRVFSNSDENLSAKIADLKKQGYDCFIFDYAVGDNYMVAVVNKAQIIKDVPTVAKDQNSHNAESSETDAMHSDRDSEGNTLTAEQQEFFKDSQVRWGNNLMPVYHGTRRKFTVFDASEGYDDNRIGGLLWAAKDYDYAKDYSYLDEPIVMKGYLNITKMLDIGDIDMYPDYAKRLREIADLVKATPSELEAMATYDHVKYIYDITSSKNFRDRIVELGYDGVTAQESGLQTFGFVDSNQFKDTTNKNPTSNPDIHYSDRVLMGSLFSGGGTLEAGLTYQMLDKQFAVEYNKKIASVYTDNHGKEHMFVGDVRDFDSKEKQNVFYLHASPVCKNYSTASHSGGETTLDITTAEATARVLEEQMPQVFTVENVKRYIGSEAYNIITNKLNELGYTWDVDVYKASDYGNATKRERMIIRAVKDVQLPAKPQKASTITSWGEATRDLWETDLIPSNLVKSKIEAIKNTPKLKGVKLTKLDKPLLIYDTTKSKTINFAWADELAPTLTTKCGDARIIMPDGRVYAPTPKFMGRIQGLPDNYKYPKATTNAFKIIGNGIPTQLTKAVMGGVLDSAYAQTHDGEVLYSDRVTAEEDAEYMDAYYDGDEDKMQELVDRVANRLGYNYKAYHHTENSFTVFDLNKARKSMDIQGFYFSADKDAESEYGSVRYDTYLKMTKPYIVDSKETQNAIPFDMSKGNAGVIAREWLQKQGYDSVIRKAEYFGAEADEYIVFDSSQIKSSEPMTYSDDEYGEGDVIPLSERFNADNDDIRFSERDTDAVSNRTLLANALESVAQNDIEKSKLALYKNKIALIESEQKKLAEIKAKANELRFTKGRTPGETKTMRDLDAEATQLANRINTYDKQLLNLESTKAIKNVLEREKTLLRKRLEQKGKEAIKAQKEKNAKTVRELMNRHTESRKKAIEGRHKTEIRGKIRKFKEEMQRELEHPTDRVYIPAKLAQAIIDLCDLINTDTPLYKADGSLNMSQERRNQTKERLLRLRVEYENLKNDPDALLAEEYEEAVSKYFEKLRTTYDGKSLMEMSLEELEEMYSILKSIDSTLKEARKTIGWADAQDIYEAGDAIAKEQIEIAQKRKKSERSAGQKAKDWVIDYTLSPVRNVERMSGYKEGSFLTKLFHEFERGVRKKNFFVMKAYALFEALAQGKKYEDAVYKAHGATYTDAYGRKFSVSKMQMMQTILSHEREVENGMTHIENGGFTFADLKLLNDGKLKEAISEENSHRVDVAVAMKMVFDFREALADDQWAQDYMNAARTFFDGMAKDAVNETYLALKHRIIARDKKYIPFETDRHFVVREISAQNDIQQTINSYGMLQETKKGASQPLIISGLNNIVDRHIEQVGNIQGLAIPIRNFNKIWNVRTVETGYGNDPTVKGIIERNWGIGGTKLITQTVQDLQGARPNEQSWLYRKVKSGYITAKFVMNLSVVLKQVGSLFTSTSMLRMRNPASMIGNLVYTMFNSKKISAEVDKYTASVWMRRQGLSDNEVHTLMTEAKKPGLFKALNKVPSAVNPTKWITAMDSVVALSLWKYAKEDTAARTGLKGEELLKATAEFYDSVIENTQSMSDVLHKPEVQKRGDIISESLGMFKTDLYQTAGQLQVTLGRYKANKTKENKRALVRTVYSITASTIWSTLFITSLMAMVRYKVDPYRDDEDEDITLESWLKRLGYAFGGEMASYVFPLAGGELADVVENLMYGESTDDAIDSLALTAVNDLISTMTSIGANLKEGESPSATDLEKLLTKSLEIFGIPATNITRIVKSVKLHAQDISNGEFLSFEAGAERTAAHHIHRLIEAVESGKTDVADGLFNDAVEAFTDTNEALSKLKTALGKKYTEGEVSKGTVADMLEKYFDMDEDEIYWQFDKWDYAIANGTAEDYSKYGDLIEAMESGQNIKAVVNEYTSNGVEPTTLRSQVTKHFKPLYKEAYQSGDTTEMGRIRQILYASGLYGTANDVVKTTASWLKD